MGHMIATCRLLERDSLDIINCDDTINRFLLEDYCRCRAIIVAYESNNKIVEMLLDNKGVGIGVFTCDDTDDYNEVLKRKELARLSQRVLVRVLGSWIAHEPILVTSKEEDVEPVD